MSPTPVPRTPVPPLALKIGADDVQRLLFIRRRQAFGFSVDQVRELLAVVEDAARDCTEDRDLAQAHLETVRARLAELHALERDMVNVVHRCETACVGGPGPSCVPLAESSRHPSSASSTLSAPARAGRATRAVRDARATRGRRA